MSCSTAGMRGLFPRSLTPGGCTRAHEKPDLLPVLGDELPQRPHVLVRVVNARHPAA